MSHMLLHFLRWESCHCPYCKLGLLLRLPSLLAEIWCRAFLFLHVRGPQSSPNGIRKGKDKRSKRNHLEDERCYSETAVEYDQQIWL
jgi:hypothetical protein